MKNTFCLLLLSIFLFNCNSKKENKNGVTVENDNFLEFTKLIDGYSEEILKKGNTNSFSLAIYKDGKMYQNYYGVIDKGSNTKLTDSSQYEIASITKTFTGALVAKAVLEGKLSLEDDIRMYFEDEYPNLEYQGIPVTIKNLLTHSIGFDDKDDNGLYAMSNKINRGNFNSDKVNYTIQDFFAELKTVKIINKPGTVYAYNSVGPELLAYILEKVNKKPFDEQLNDFLEGLGMHHTYMQKHDIKHENLIKSYDGEKLATLYVSPFYGAAGGAISTLPDLATYMKYLVDNKEEPWIKEASKTLFVDEEDDENIGYLWQNIGYADEEGYYYSKTGTATGTQSGVLICPDSNYGIVLITNNTSDRAFNDWGTLFFKKIEPDVIKYPRLNLFSKYKEAIISGSKEALVDYNELKADTTNYYTPNAGVLNDIGYEYLALNKKAKAIATFEFATQQFPNNFNLFDSLGEAYYINKQYKKALENYKKALELNPKSENAKRYIDKIEKLILEKNYE